MLYYELEDGLYTAGPYFFAKVRTREQVHGTRHYTTLQERGLWKYSAVRYLWLYLEEFQRFASY